MNLLERLFSKRKQPQLFTSKFISELIPKLRHLTDRETELFYDSYLSTLNGKQLSHLKFKVRVYQAKLAKKPTNERTTTN